MNTPLDSSSRLQQLLRATTPTVPGDALASMTALLAGGGWGLLFGQPCGGSGPGRCGLGGRWPALTLQGVRFAGFFCGLSVPAF